MRKSSRPFGRSYVFENARKPKENPTLTLHQNNKPDASAILGLGDNPDVPGRSLCMGLNLFDFEPFVVPKKPQEHGLFLGTTGSGKSRAMVWSAYQLARAGNGLVFIDPKGDAVNLLMQLLALNPYMARRVVYWPVADPEHIVSFNPCHRFGLDISVQVDMVVESLLRIWNAEDIESTPTLARRLPSAIEILIRTGNTLLEGLDLFSMARSDRRKAILDQARQLDDLPEFLLDDWDRLENIKSERIRESELLSGFNRFYGLCKNAHARLALGQTEHCIDIEAWMDQKKIVLVDASPRKGRDLSDLTVTMLLNTIALLAIQREGKQKDAHVYVFCDEYSRYITKSVTDSLPFTRSYGVWFWLSTQFLGQLGRNKAEQEYFLASVLTNCNIIFALGGMSPADCEVLVDTMFSGQINFKEPLLHRTFFEPLQEWMDIVSRSRGGSRTVTDTLTKTKNRQRNTVHSEQWGEGMSSGEATGTSDPVVFDPTNPNGSRITATKNTGLTTKEGGGVAHGELQGEGEAHASGISEGESWNESSTPTLVTFYKKCQEVASYYGLPAQRYRIMALLQNLPRAVAAIRYRNHPTQFVGIRYVGDPPLRPGGWKRFLKKMLNRSYVLPVGDAQSHIAERRQRLFDSRRSHLNRKGTSDDINKFFGGL